MNFDPCACQFSAIPAPVYPPPIPDLRLPRQQVDKDWLGRWYQVTPQPVEIAFKNRAHLDTPPVMVISSLYIEARVGSPDGQTAWNPYILRIHTFPREFSKEPIWQTVVDTQGINKALSVDSGRYYAEIEPKSSKLCSGTVKLQDYYQPLFW